jgi:hypothetical protein
MGDSEWLCGGFSHARAGRAQGLPGIGPRRAEYGQLGVELAVELPSVQDPRQAAELVRVAHGICPYSNATRGNIDVVLSVNGVALDVNESHERGGEWVRMS